jgi:hypothetical protein
VKRETDVRVYSEQLIPAPAKQCAKLILNHFRVLGIVPFYTLCMNKARSEGDVISKVAFHSSKNYKTYINYFKPCIVRQISYMCLKKMQLVS